MQKQMKNRKLVVIWEIILHFSIALIELINLTCSIWKNSKNKQKRITQKRIACLSVLWAPKRTQGTQNVIKVALKRSQGLNTSYGKYKKVIITINTKT